MTASPTPDAGFSLVQMMVILTVVALTATIMLPAGNGVSEAAKKDVTLERLNVIEKTLVGWRAANTRIPCPADGSLAFNNSNFGIEASSSTSCTTGTPAANFNSGNVAGGMIPARTLGLPDEYALDGWGRRFTYIVDKRATKASTVLLANNPVTITYGSNTINISYIAHPLVAGDTVVISGSTSVGTVPASTINRTYVYTGTTALGSWMPNSANVFNVYSSTLGAIGVGSVTGGGANVRVTVVLGRCDGVHQAASQTPAIAISASGNGPGSGKNAVLAIISHGKNGHGAFLANGSSVANRVNSGSTDTQELTNANVDSNFNLSVGSSVFSTTATTTFDDIVTSTNRCK